MSNQLPDADILAMMVSEAIFQLFGFGPSQDVCVPFARQVIAEAVRVRAEVVSDIRDTYGVSGTPAGRKGVQIVTVAEYVEMKTGQPYIPPRSRADDA